MFGVIGPDGGEVTSTDKIQVGTSMGAPETRPGIVIDKVPEPVGTAPSLTESGTVKLRETRGAVTKPTPNDVVIQAISPAGKEQKIKKNKEDRYQYIGEPGIWKITSEY